MAREVQIGKSAFSQERVSWRISSCCIIISCLMSVMSEGRISRYTFVHCVHSCRAVTTWNASISMRRIWTNTKRLAKMIECKNSAESKSPSLHPSVAFVCSIQTRNARSPPAHASALPRTLCSLLSHWQRLLPLFLATGTDLSASLCTPHLSHAMRV